MSSRRPRSGARAPSDGAPPARQAESRRTPSPPTAVDARALLGARREPEFETVFLREPVLEFGHRQSVVDPKVGLALHGPFDVTDAGRRTVLRVGVIGPGDMVDKARAWLERCQGSVQAVRRRRQAGKIVTTRMNPLAVPTFPGIPEAFDAQFVIPASMVETLTAAEVSALTRLEFFEDRVSQLVTLLVRRLRVLSERETVPDVVIIALPTEVRRLCTVASRHKQRARQPKTLAQGLRAGLARDAATGQLNLLDVAAVHGVALDDPADEEHAILHHGLKARAMEINLPTQLVWEQTLDGVNVEDDATRAWNFWTGMYYKAGGELWRVTGLAPGTCFVGLAFYHDRRDTTLRTCMAQAFSDRGEGIVLRSEPFQWTESRDPHLPETVAADLMSRVLDAYESHWKQRPSRVVVHKWQRYRPEERAGFEGAIARSGVHSHDLVAFGNRGIRFYRTGQEPVLRGTMVKLGRGNALLYTRGYVPFVGEYTGMRVPKPLEIVEHHGSAPLTQVAAEILALTKLDWNSTAFAGREPITTAFAKDVGHILAELPPGANPKSWYRFYM